MALTAVLGLALAVLALAAAMTERRSAARSGRRIRPWFIVTDLIGGVFGVTVAVVELIGIAFGS